MRDVLALLLAGGVGSRLNILVRKRAKPAVPFGGIYRIIDFTLSNAANADLSCVGILTQYKPLSLMDHIRDGSAWDLSGRTREIKILPPKTGEKDWDWYKGTADAVRQNLDFINQRPSKQVLILSGDHVYRMDYRPLIAFHRQKKAHLTVAMMEVPWEDTRHFGIAITNEEGLIVDWEEKPLKARSNLASMGIYVFDTAFLVDILREVKEEDFGMHILPYALKVAKVYAYKFQGYWKDVGTLESYFQSNMDLLRPSSGLDPEAWNIMTNFFAGDYRYDWPPAKIHYSARIENSIISPGCEIAGEVKNSIISPGVKIEEGALVQDSIVMHKSKIASKARIYRAIVDKEVFIGEDVLIGQGDPKIKNKLFPAHLYTGITLIGKGAYIPGGSRIGCNCIINPGVKSKDFPEDLLLGDGETLEVSL